MEQPTKKQQNHKQDLGTSTKKKKDRENRNSITNDLVSDWSQKNELVIVSLLIGPGHDNRTVNINTEPTRLSVSLTDGRKFVTKLFETIVPEGTSISFRGPRCIIKLLKNDPTIDWIQLEPTKNTPERIITCRVKSNSPSPSKNAEKDDFDDKIDNNVITVSSIKTDHVEREAESLLVVFLYVKNVNKETAAVKFTEDSVTIRFSTSDARFLQQHSGSTEESVFGWYLTLKDKVVLDECKFKVNANNIEIKLKKQVNKQWGSPTTVSPDTGSNKVVKNTWMAASKGETPSLSNIPPAPPTPPTPTDSKKPMCLVSPVTKGMRGSPPTSYPSSSGMCDSSNAVTPKGTTGLDNIGNTCFMNSVLQCLVNTRELREYFLDQNFQQDINKDNPLGMGGKLAVSFAILMKLLWSGTLRSHAPTKLKSMMSMKANQFSGFAQHDAQEFMVELLDGLHEDLNRIKKKPYIAEPPDLDGWPDHKAAAESWKLHKMRNDSIIDDLFKGQFKSTLTCHQCNKISVKFDEFCCLSVPIPKDQKVIQVIFFWKDPYHKPKKFFIRVCADAGVEELKNELSELTDVQTLNIQVFEMFKSKIHKIFAKGASLAAVGPSDTLMAYEVYSQHQVGEPVVEVAVVQRMLLPNPPTRCAYCSRSAAPGIKLRRCTKCYRAGYCHQACQTNHWSNHKAHCKLVPEPVGCPFILSLPESHATYSRLTCIMEAYARYSVDIFQPPVSHDSSHRGSTSSIELSGEENEDMEVEDGNSEAKAESNDMLMAGESNDVSLTGESSQGDTQSQWADEGAGSSDQDGVGVDTGGGGSDGDSGGGNGDELPQLSTSPSVRAVQPRGSLQLPSATQLFVIRPVNNRAQNLPAPNGETLEDKGDEPLDLSDKYYLAMDWRTNEKLPVHCLVQNKEVDCEVEGSYSVQRNQQTTLEACVDLFTQPENLSEGDSWRCPRCKMPVEATKQMSIWRLPHILIIQLKRFSFKYVLYSDKIDKFVQYPVRGLNVQPYMSCEPDDGPAIYDLYGVCNHMGRLLGGHYTAYGRTLGTQDTRQSEIDWRLFDDSRVNFCPESRVVNEQAYLLLYRRRDTPFVVHRPLPPPAPVVQEEVSQEQTVEAEEATPMSISSTSQLSSSQPSSSSLEGEEQLSTTQEELD